MKIYHCTMNLCSSIVHLTATYLTLRYIHLSVARLFTLRYSLTESMHSILHVSDPTHSAAYPYLLYILMEMIIVMNNILHSRNCLCVQENHYFTYNMLLYLLICPIHYNMLAKYHLRLK